MHELDELADRFWRWRAVQMPRWRDDIVRVARPHGWLPEVDPALLGRRGEQAAAFAAELARIRPREVPDRVDHRLLRSALARLRWESEVLQVRAIPRFWIDQSIGPVFDALLRPGVDANRVTQVVGVLKAVPAVVQVALDELGAGTAREFAQQGAAELDGIEERLTHCADALAALVPDAADELRGSAGEAAAALLALRTRLLETGPSLALARPVGATAYEWFLREVACVPLTLIEIADVGRREYERATWLELIRLTAARDVALPKLPADASAQCADELVAQEQVREFSNRTGLLTRPHWLRRYTNAPMPDYLQPLRFLGVADDLTDAGRLTEDAVSYVPAPGPQLPYFYAANARDPRAGIVHEGAHYEQLARSWAHPRPIRRHYYDSGANEGIAFYNEELMLTAGLFDDAPHTRTAVTNFMKLRALRVSVDVGLATGELTMPDAAEQLRTRVPMDAATAAEEAAFFAETPGQALTYQIGKTQLIALLADAVRLQGAGLDLRALHDRIWANGNVPIALQRWEILGLTDELAAIDTA